MIVVVVGTVLSVAAAFGPVWLVRIGLVVAIAAAIIATVLAWREVRADRHRHAAAMLATNRAHGAALRMERAQNSAVLQVVTERNVAALAEITRQQTVIAQLRGDVSSLKGDRAALTAEVARRQELIASLEETVRVREAQLRALSEGDEAEVHTMPRRGRVDGVLSAQAGDEAEEMWTDGTHPTVVDMAVIDSYLIGEPVLPNYEEDRRLA
jgi:hypothetical protein